MSPLLIIYVLTGAAVVVIVLTQLPLGIGNGSTGRLEVGHTLVRSHAVVGGLATVLWLLFLVADPDTIAGSLGVGIAAVGLWWLEAVIGLLMLVRWMPTRGRHAPEGPAPLWVEGPWPSVLAHLTMVLVVFAFTWAYLTALV